jgi:hypothetical protein
VAQPPPALVSAPVTGQATALAQILAGAVDGVVQAQRQLDADALTRVAQFIDTPAGGLTLPPLWYTFSDVGIELEMSASVARLDLQPRGGAVRLDARLLNPTAVSLFGFSASSGMRVSLRLSPREAATAVPPLPAPVPSPPPPPPPL